MLTSKGKIFASILIFAALSMAAIFSMCSSSEEDRLNKFQEDYNAYKVHQDTIPAPPTHMQDLKIVYPPEPVRVYEKPLNIQKKAKTRYPKLIWGNNSNIRVELGPYGDFYVVDDQSIYLSSDAAKELAASDSVAIFNPHLHGYLLAALEMIKSGVQGPVDINTWLEQSDDDLSWIGSGDIEPEVQSSAIGLSATFIINGDTISTAWIPDYLRAVGYPDDMEIEMSVSLEAARSLVNGDPGAAFRNADAVFERGTGKTLAEYGRYVSARKLAEK